ncbi:gas vesicle protein [Streptomyces bathyalis]|uniref:Gas vesicle protein n=1 Tax=Streptomyces bathyalis TaxID=2710756 RepID=A0A7T1WUH2_9ACTN|nr:gas vesicle protein [Streptomyces bathyalis]QPP09656.1 gas vesicle protein [Streptomyces bathyalis]
MGPTPSRAVPYGQQGSSSANLADILERVLDKGVVIAGDIQINLLDIELLTIKLRLLVVSVDKAKEMGIDWWENDPSLSSRAAVRSQQSDAALNGGENHNALAEENDRLRREIERLRSSAELPAGEGTGESGSAGKGSARKGTAARQSGGDGTRKRGR